MFFFSEFVSLGSGHMYVYAGGPLASLATADVAWLLTIESKVFVTDTFFVQMPLLPMLPHKVCV